MRYSKLKSLFMLDITQIEFCKYYQPTVSKYAVQFQNSLCELTVT